MKHTPGPWHLSENNTSVWAKSPWNAIVRIAEIRVHASMNGIDHEANARLIENAPELYEILFGLFHGTRMELEPIMNDRIVNVLRKVKGEE